MRRWSHEQVTEVLPGGPRARRAHGAGASSRLPLAVWAAIESDCAQDSGGALHGRANGACNGAARGTGATTSECSCRLGASLRQRQRPTIGGNSLPAIPRQMCQIKPIGLLETDVLTQRFLHRSGGQSICLGGGLRRQCLVRTPVVVEVDPVCDHAAGVLQSFEPVTDRKSVV